MQRSAFSTRLGAIAAGLEGFAAQAGRAVRQNVVAIAEQARDRAADLTPRSDEPEGQHTADAWRVDVLQGSFGDAGGDLTVVVHNVSERANAPIQLQSGGETTLLTILEYGSAPHLIEPRIAKALVFFSRTLGRVVRAKLVRHPGTPAYNMITIASVEAAVSHKRFLDALRTVLRLALTGNLDRLRGGGLPFPARR